jgi:hypothetical protein
VDPPVHVTSHAPQLRGLSERFVHVPLQSDRVAAQAQLPFEQMRSAGHVCAQPPQLLGSASVFTHELPQRMVGAAHWSAHFPASHTCVWEHGTPQAPQ